MELHCQLFPRHRHGDDRRLRQPHNQDGRWPLDGDRPHPHHRFPLRLARQRHHGPEEPPRPEAPPAAVAAGQGGHRPDDLPRQEWRWRRQV
eukprot:1795706-Prymnesium_polylepis.1